MTPETTPSSPPDDDAPHAGSETATEKGSENLGASAFPLDLPTWEDDETRATAVLRALFTVLGAGFLAYAQWKAPANWPGSIGQNWGRWVWTSVVCNLAFPLGIVWMFFGQGLLYQEYLRDQKNNSWNFGWNFTHWRRHLKIALVCWLVFLPFLLFFSRNSDMRAAYALYLPSVNGLRDWAFLLSTLILYMFCWEWFFRGFMLFGIAPGLGFVPAIALQAILFGLTHLGKPDVEVGSAFAGGLVLGTLCWREKSFLPGFLIHALIHVTWAILVLI